MKIYENTFFKGLKIMAMERTLEDGKVVLEGACVETGPSWHGKVGHVDYWNPASFKEIVETVNKRRKKKPKE